MPKSLVTYDGKLVHLSDEIYQIKYSPITKDNAYKAGTFVRLISGVDDSPKIGYHFVEHWRTVCRIDAKEAEFFGVPLNNLRKI